MSEKITRRQAVKRLAKLGGAAALTVGAYGGLYGRNTLAAPETRLEIKSDFRIPGAPDQVVVARSNRAGREAELVAKVLEPLGGMEKFITRGDVVAVKPNMSWDRPPELAANTSPEVLAAIVRLCYRAGAKKVHLVDNTINNAQRCYLNTGIEAVAKETGAGLLYPESKHFKDMDLGGRRLGQWSVFMPVIQADKLINAPVAKSHGLTRLTLGMKNWIGAVGGRRGALHQDIHQSIVDLARFFQPTLVLVDATRIMVRNGPSGGRLSDVIGRNTVIAGIDQVAVDAAATALFDVYPDEVGYILLAEQQGLGRIDPGAGKRIEIAV
ncbi:MAG: DUF362 domain-containing protein [Proteobacteria bacterium]|nr:DUF362 domain-containing protein [Pseudomonadota bacterium]